MNKKNRLNSNGLLPESSIMSNWDSPIIKVSIVCTAYNHALYIRDTLGGFLSQKTNFTFEIIIHDDASTDATSDIIMEYQRYYPNIIIPILQKENQYSKGKSIFTTFINPVIRGKYIAHCEGDDFWIDPLKLQKQYDELENNQSCDICFHPAQGIYPNGTKKLISFHSDKERIIPIGVVILGGGGFMPTASIFYRKEILTKIDEFNIRYGQFPVGDVMLQFLASIKGGALYLPIVGSVYRINSIGSWSSRMQNNSEYSKSIRKKTILWNEKLNEFTGWQYDEFFKQKIQNILIGYVTNPYMDKEERLYFSKVYGKYINPISKSRM